MPSRFLKYTTIAGRNDREGTATRHQKRPLCRPVSATDDRQAGQDWWSYILNKLQDAREG